MLSFIKIRKLRRATMDNKEKALLCHKEWNGNLETIAKSKVNSREDLAIAYTRI